MVPISRHFLPELQVVPPHGLTTGLINGSLLPFASTCVGHSLDAADRRSLAAAPLAAAPLPATVPPVGLPFRGHWSRSDGASRAPSCTAALLGPSLPAWLRWQRSCGCATCLGRTASIVTVSQPRRQLCVGSRAVRILPLRPSAAFEAAAALSCTAFMVARVFWMTLGLCARGQPRGQHANENRHRRLHLHPVPPISSPGLRPCWPAPPDPDHD